MERTGVLLTDGTIKREKYYKDNPEALKLISREVRAKIRKGAHRLHEAGATAGAAEAATEKAGFVYVITNPAFPGFVKIGRAYDPVERLRGYQTGCPFRRYRLAYAIFFEDVVLAEKEIHLRLDSCRAEGEWFRITPAVASNHIDNLRSIL